MVQSIINLNESNDRILNIVKAQYGFKNKSQAMELIIEIYGDSFLEPKLRPEYIKKLMTIEKEGYGKTFSSVEELEKSMTSM